MRKLIVYQVDSFSKDKFKGNPAGVVLNADGLDSNQMQLIARELNNSETAFLFKSDNNNDNGLIRYFTPKNEVPTCGHATIAAMYAKAMEENLDSSVLRYKTQIGTLPFEIIRRNGDYDVVMTQGSFELSSPLDNDFSNNLILALGLKVTDINPNCPLQIASTGHSKIIIGIKNRETLNSLKPDLAELAKLSKSIGCNGFFVFTFDSNNKNILTHGRMFAPAIGINEDPVTGNANGPLGGYLIKNKLVKHNNKCFEFNGMQGEKINREGIVKVRVKIKENSPSLIQIIGTANIIFRTEIEL